MQKKSIDRIAAMSSVIAPLRAEPVIMVDDASTTDESLDRFKCGICFDCIDDPVGCGTCVYRFCRKCLEQVSGSSGPTGTPRREPRRCPRRCPTCRVIFTEMQPDTALQE